MVALSGSHEVEVEVRVNRRGVVDGARDVAAKVPNDTSGTGVKTGGTEGEGLRAGVQDFLQNLVVRGAIEVRVSQEEPFPEA
jgi:hypothetical protein